MNFKFGIDDKVKLITHDLNGVIMRLCKEKECYVYDVEYINNNGKIEEIRCFESDLELLKVGVNG
jgi:hypothetical protein